MKPCNQHTLIKLYLWSKVNPLDFTNPSLCPATIEQQFMIITKRNERKDDQERNNKILYLLEGILDIWYQLSFMLKSHDGE